MYVFVFYGRYIRVILVGVKVFHKGKLKNIFFLAVYRLNILQTGFLGGENVECHAGSNYMWYHFYNFVIMATNIGSNQISKQVPTKAPDNQFNAQKRQNITHLIDNYSFHNQRTNGPVNAHLISWPSKAQNIQNLENIW